MSDSTPVYRNNQVIFQKAASELIVAAYDNGVLVIHGWTVSILLDDVKAYVQDFGRNRMPDVQSGFFFHEGNFVISHNGAKLSLTADEGTAFVKFLAGHYGPGVRHPGCFLKAARVTVRHERPPGV